MSGRGIRSPAAGRGPRRECRQEIGPSQVQVHRRVRRVNSRRDRSQRGKHNVRRLVDSCVLENLSPPHVAANRGDIVHWPARTGKYLEAAGGTPSGQLFTLARRGLASNYAMLSRRWWKRAARWCASRSRSKSRIGAQNIRLPVEPLGNPETARASCDRPRPSPSRFRAFHKVCAVILEK